MKFSQIREASKKERKKIKFDILIRRAEILERNGFNFKARTIRERAWRRFK